MRTVLSTKILTLSQKELLLNSGIALVEYDALEISFSSFRIPTDSRHIIVTSKNGAKAFLKAYDAENEKTPKSKFHFYCVGEKTQRFLEDFGFKVVTSALNSYELGILIAEKHNTHQFIFISGNLRRNEIPEIFQKNNIRYDEINGYTTHLKKKTFSTSYDGLLFFSPSGIKSFSATNSISNTLVFCIGETTAAEAKKHTENIIVANRPTVENVLVQVIKHYKKND